MATEPGQILPAYLLLGDDSVKAGVAIARMAKLCGCNEDGYDSFDLAGKPRPDVTSSLFDDSVDMTGAGPDQDLVSRIQGALTTLPLFSERRLVVLKNFDHAPKEIQTLVVDYLSEPTASTVLLVTASKLATTNPLVKTVKGFASQAMIDCTPKKKRDLGGYIRNLAHDFGLQMDYAAAEKMASLTAGDTQQIRQEMEKLLDYSRARGSAQVDLGMVDALVNAAQAPTVWQFGDAVFAGNLPLAYHLYAHMPKETPIHLLASCVFRLRGLLRLKSLQESGMRSPKQLATQTKRQEWQVKKDLAVLEHYDLAVLRQALIDAAGSDAQMKSGFNQEAAFALWLFSFAAAR
ncbi:MAG: DNA polymerase III subunit delta [Coriobacteriales bacterium]|jgi:DNA polymerase-3 subunit delta|nr:DNA polymerase III subunit delta [Coriobacteriales bacterium]